METKKIKVKEAFCYICYTLLSILVSHLTCSRCPRPQSLTLSEQGPVFFEVPHFVEPIFIGDSPSFVKPIFIEDSPSFVKPVFIGDSPSFVKPVL